MKQAQKWAQSKASTKSEAYIYSYRLDKLKENPEMLSDFKILELLQYDKNWVDFISQSVFCDCGTVGYSSLTIERQNLKNVWRMKNADNS